MSDILGQALIFTSTLHYPQDLMPEPMRFITIGNFLSAGANLLRAGFGLQQISIQDLTLLQRGVWFSGVLAFEDITDS